MASLFGDDIVDDLLNDNVQQQDELPSDDDDKHNVGGDNLFGEDGENGAEEQKAVKVEPKKRSVRNPRPRLTADTLSGPRGIQTIEEYFTDIKFKGKCYEKQDLDEVMRRLQHWAHRMYPTYKFDDVLANIDRLGKKKPLQVHMSRYRLGLLEHLNTKTGDEMHDDDDNDAVANATDEPFDEFDALLGEQIAISKLAPHTPASSRFSAGGESTAATSLTNSRSSTPSFARANSVMSTPYSEAWNDSDLAQPLPPSQPSTPAHATNQLSAEQLTLIAENRRKAQERLKANRLKQQNSG